MAEKQQADLHEEIKEEKNTCMPDKLRIRIFVYFLLRTVALKQNLNHVVL